MGCDAMTGQPIQHIHITVQANAPKSHVMLSTSIMNLEQFAVIYTSYILPVP